MPTMTNSDDLPHEIDFTAGMRGKFYRPEATLNLPISLDTDVLGYSAEVVAKKGLPVSELANDLLKREIAIIKSIK